MFNVVLAQEEIHSLIDLIPSIHDWYLQFGYLGTTWLNGTHVSFVHVVLSMLSVAVVALLILGSWNKFKPMPDAKLTPRTFFELIIELVHGLLKEQMHDDKKARKYLPLVFGLAIFIFFNNIMALIPGLAPGTSNLNTNVGMALLVFCVSTIAGIRENGIGHYIGELCGPKIGNHRWLAPLMLPIEIIGQLVRPITLSVRLMGNMYGDHAVVAILTTLVAAAVPAVMMCLGALVVVIQTAVFCILTVVYISMAVAKAEE